MFDSGLKAAINYGDKLMSFENLEEAENFFFSYIDKNIKRLERVSLKKNDLVIDYSVDSLKTVEKLYYDMYEKNEFTEFELTREDFEMIMDIYFGEVVVKNCKEAEWAVKEYPFVKDKYDLFIVKHLCSVAVIGSFRNLYNNPNNKRKTFMFREYNKYFNR